MEDLKPKIDELQQALAILEGYSFDEASKVLIDKIDEYGRMNQLQEMVKEWRER